MISPTFLLITASFLPSFTDALSCPGLNGTKAQLKNAHIFPNICLNKTVPFRTACYWVCNKGYGFRDDSHTETECNLQRYDNEPDWRNHYFYDNECKSTTKCPALDGNSWIYPSCTAQASNVGSVCKALSCTSEQGPEEKLCQSNGTWTPLGGRFCPPGPLPITIHCQDYSIVKTDPGKATADVTARFSFPTSGIADSEIIIDNGKDLRALPKGYHSIKYTINTKSVQLPKYCSVGFRVLDKEPPRVLRCPKHLLYTASAGLEARIVLDSANEVRFYDNVDGLKTHYQPPSRTEVSVNDLKPPGVYTMIFSTYDSSNNHADCVITVVVKAAKPCQMKVPPPNAFPVADPKKGAYFSKCRNGTSHLCEGSYSSWMHFDFMRCNHDYHFFTGVDCSGGVMNKPLIGCVNDSALVAVENGTCPNGTVLGNRQKLCFPCERSMFFNQTAKMCHVCPPNTTNDEYSSLTCYPCPKHQMTRLTKAPRFCEDICSPGSWLDPTNTTCTNCTYGYYVMSGARKCTKCPEGLTTLDELSTKLEDCVYGRSVIGDSGSEQMKPANASLYRLKIKPNAFKDSRKYRPIALRFQSTYLKQVTNCSKDFVRVTAVLNEVRFDLTPRLCGEKISEPIFVDTTEVGLIVEFSVSDASNASLNFTFGRADCQIGEIFDFSTAKCMKCPLNTYQTMINATSCIQCGNGTVTRENGAAGCVSLCPKGTFIKGTSCQECPLGYYQDEAEKTSCIKCPNNTITRRGHSTSISDCTVPCNAGQFKSKDSCKPCKNGMYQDIDVHAYEFCKFCRKGTTTIEYGSKSNDSCVVACSYEGEYYDPKDGQCKKCPIGTYKLASDKQVLQCTKCPTNHTTNRIGAASVSECIDSYDNCSPNPCKFPGWCEDTGMGFKCHCPHNYVGKYCENRTHACESQPCLNNGTCHNLYLGDNNYRCQCPPAFTGRNCESEYHPCLENRNLCNRGNCTDSGGKFTCHCPPWHEGTNCENSLRKPCMKRPCGRHGDCNNGPHQGSNPPYTCSCWIGYTGKNCETVINYCLKNDCNKTGTQACEDREKSFHCRCKIGFKGVKCEVALGCPPGESFDGKKCFKCGIGKFQPFRGHFDCQNCPDKKTTLEEAATSRDQCIEKESFVKLKATVRITSENWSADLLNKNSYSYVQLRKKLEDAIKKTYANESKYVAVVIESVRKGSIVCEFSLYFKSGVESPAKPLKAKVETGSLGEFTVDKDSYKAVIVEESHKKEKNNYTLMAVLLVVGVLVVIGVVTLCLLHARHKKRSRVRFDKMLMDETATIEYPMTDK